MAAGIPNRGRGARQGSGGQHGGELGVPLILAIKRQGIGKVAFKQLRRFFRRVQNLQALLLGGFHVHAKTFELIENLAAGNRGGAQQIVKQDVQYPEADCGADKHHDAR